MIFYDDRHWGILKLETVVYSSQTVEFLTENVMRFKLALQKKLTSKVSLSLQK